MEKLKQTFEKNFETRTEKGLMCAIVLMGLFAFGCALFGAWWHIFTGTVCMLIYLALRSEMRKEAGEGSHV